MTLLSFMNKSQISCTVEAFERFGKSSRMLIFEKTLYFSGPVRSHHLSERDSLQM